MKNQFKLFGVAVLFMAIVFSFAACGGGDDSDTTPTMPTITSVAEFTTWLAGKPANTAATAYHVKLNVSSLGGGSETPGSVGKALKDSDRFVSLDLSGSNLNSIEAGAFAGCEKLTSITIPSGVTSVHTPLLSIAL